MERGKIERGGERGRGREGRERERERERERGREGGRDLMHTAGPVRLSPPSDCPSGFERAEKLVMVSKEGR